MLVATPSDPTRRNRHPVVDKKYTAQSVNEQINCSFSELKSVLSNLNDTGLLQRLEAYHLVGRRGYPLRALWRAYVSSFLFNFPNTNALIRELEDRPDFRIFCGFRTLPHRTTFNRFINRLSYHADMVESILADLTNNLKAILPDLGNEVAIDSTVVESYSSPNKALVSDPEASWTAKNSPRAKKGGKEWKFGYKVHMATDANHGLPLAHFITTAKRNDSPELPSIVALTEHLFPWFKARAVMADRGYDAMSNHQYLNGKGILPIIPMRKAPHTKNGWYEGVYTAEGVPTCIGQIPMRFVRSDPEKGYLYRCVGCPLAKTFRGGIRHCDTEVWEDPTRNLRLFGAIRRQSPEWKALYAKRQAIERVFKSLKQSRRLEKPTIRGFRKMRLHAAMSVMAFQATALANLQAGRTAEVRWMVRRVA